MFLHTALARIERVAGQLQGKGWGASTTKREVAQILKHIPYPKTVLDVGGNVGTWTESLLQQAPTATVFIFEPSLTNVNRLREKFKAASNVHVVPQALSDRDGEQLLFSNEAGSGIASLHQRDLSHYGIPYETSEKVSLVSFKSFMQREGLAQIDILKLDIEGHEYQVLHSLTSAELANIGLIQFEFGGCNIDSRVFFRDFWKQLKEQFVFYRISPLGLARLDQYSERDERFEISNYLCVNRNRK